MDESLVVKVLLDEKIGVTAETEEEGRIIEEIAERNGLMWRDGERIFKKVGRWGCYGAGTIYVFENSISYPKRAVQVIPGYVHDITRNKLMKFDELMIILSFEGDD